MTFNWFNRFNKKDAEQPEPIQEAEAAPIETVPIETAPIEEAPTEATSEEDARIANARAIVESFRRKQQEKSQQPEATSIEESVAVPEAIVESPDAIEDGLIPSSDVIEPVIGAIKQAETELIEQLEEPAPALPLWAQADSQARLERLRATAIVEEPEPIVAPAPAFTIDEGFLWSAEVLSAMGRRAEDVSIEEITWLKRLRQGLDKTRRSLVNQLKAIVGQGPLNQDAVYEIESLLLQADAGVEATDKIIESLQAKLRQETLPPDQAIAYLKQLLRDLLDQPLQGTHSAFFAPEKDTLNIWLMTGVNGAGKTTTIGKLAHIATKSGYKCLIGAADTFRAAAVEQVKVWGQRSNVEVIANPGQNTDPAAVVFDAISAAQSRGTELLLIDTAGRLQNKKNLMDELSKVRRIIDKKAGDAKVESLLVLDATLGQNGLRQAEVFAQAAQLSGVVLTKLDGTAKGGIALAVVEQLGLPIRFIGAGEGIEDLRPFSSYEFVEALISG